MKRTLKALLILPLLAAIMALAGACDDSYSLPSVEDGPPVTRTGGEPELYLRVTPQEVMPGQDMDIEVQFYPEGEMELVLWVEGEGYGPFYTDAAGYFYGAFTIDPFSPPGEYMITAELPGPGMQASEYYTVLGDGSMPVPPPPTGTAPAPQPTAPAASSAGYSRCDIVVTGPDCGAEVRGVTGSFSGNIFTGRVSYDLNATAHAVQSVTVVLDGSMSMVQDFQMVEVINYDPPEESWRSDQKQRQTTVIGNDIPRASSGSSGILSDTLAFEITGAQVIQHISMKEFLLDYYSGEREVDTMDGCGLNGPSARISIVLY